MIHLKSIYCLVITSNMLGIIVLKITYAACLELLTKASTGGDHCWRITYAACLDLLTEASKGGHYCWRITYAACLKLLTEASKGEHYCWRIFLIPLLYASFNTYQEFGVLPVYLPHLVSVQ